MKQSHQTVTSVACRSCGFSTDRRVLWLVLLIAALLAACAGSDSTSDNRDTSTPMADSTATELAFRSAVNPPSADWQGPVFELSYDYPDSLPAYCEAGGPWKSVDVDFTAATPTWEGGWDEYMEAILEYFSEGQDPQLDHNVGWQVSPNGTPRWYHVPWMAFDKMSGREFVHGLTNELSVFHSAFVGPGRGTGTHSLPLASEGTGALFETWAFGVYNDCGAYAIGQGWPSAGEPVTVESDGRTLPKGLPFPSGSLVVKMLFTTATPDAIGYLSGSPVWLVNRHVQTSPERFETCERAVNDVHLIQIDVAVVDDRSPSNWVFGTFAYDGTRKGDTVWERLSPLGVQWGSDPKTFPAVPEAESQLARESVLAPVDIYEHFGCNGRLAGPVDEAESACLTCHQGAFATTPGTVPVMGTNISQIFEFDGICYEHNQANVDYFSNYKFPDEYPSGQFTDALPLDTSLQMYVAFLQYGHWKTSGQSASCTDVTAGL